MAASGNMKKNIGDKALKLLMACLGNEGNKPKFRWYDYDTEEWTRITGVLQEILPKGLDINQDPLTLAHLLKIWVDIIINTDDETIKECNQEALKPLPGLKYNDEARGIWCERVKTPAEVGWNVKNNGQIQDWTGKMLKIARELNPIIGR